MSRACLVLVSCVVVVSTSVWTDAAEEFANIRVDVEAIRAAAAAHKKNIGRIQTWQGRAIVEDVVREEDDKSVDRRTTSTVKFAFSRAQQAVRWNWSIEQRTTTINGGEVKSSFPIPHHSNGMQTNEAFYRFTFSGDSKDRGRSMLLIYPLKQQRIESQADDFHPMWYLADHGPVAAWLPFFAQEAGKPQFAWKVSRSGELVVVEQAQNSTSRYRFSLARGGNIVASYVAGQDDSQQRHWTYEQVGDIWLPKSYVYTHVDRRRGGAFWRVTSRKVMFVESVLNQELDEEGFSIEKLGIKAGDVVQDTRTGTRYRYQ